MARIILGVQRFMMTCMSGEYRWQGLEDNRWLKGVHHRRDGTGSSWSTRVLYLKGIPHGLILNHIIPCDIAAPKGAG